MRIEEFHVRELIEIPRLHVERILDDKSDQSNCPIPLYQLIPEYFSIDDIKEGKY